MKNIFCCGCQKEVNARLTDGGEIYPHRQDLKDLPFWKCDQCKNYVGCHHKTQNRTRPLGVIPTKEIRSIRSQIHRVIDPMWKSGKHTRKEVYRLVSNGLGYQYHTGNIKNVEEAKKVLEIARRIEE